MTNDNKSTLIADDEAFEAEHRRMFWHVLENADDFGVTSQEDAFVLSLLLLLEKEGKLARTGEKRMSSHGDMQDVFVAVPGN
jgi:hypothetical protein